MFYILKNIFCKKGQLLSFATPETQREYTSNFLVSMSNWNVCVNQCIHNMFTVSCRQWIWNGFNSNLWWKEKMNRYNLREWSHKNSELYISKLHHMFLIINFPANPIIWNILLYTQHPIMISMCFHFST